MSKRGPRTRGGIRPSKRGEVMERPNWGTCGETYKCKCGCRWFIAFDDQDDTCALNPRTRFEGPHARGHAFSPALAVDTCSHWEPPEGRVCGNCEHHHGFGYVDGVAGTTCAMNSHGIGIPTHELQTCNAWRWRGEG